MRRVKNPIIFNFWHTPIIAPKKGFLIRKNETDQDQNCHLHRANCKMIFDRAKISSFILGFTFALQCLGLLLMGLTNSKHQTDSKIGKSSTNHVPVPNFIFYSVQNRK